MATKLMKLRLACFAVLPAIVLVAGCVELPVEVAIATAGPLLTDGEVTYRSILLQARSPADVPAITDASTSLSKDLKQRGWRFVGPTTMYAFMQAMGLVDDHLEGCASRRS